jgi:hypothetical protein
MRLRRTLNREPSQLSGAELVAEFAERFAGRRGHDFGVDLHRDGDLAVPQDLYGHARVDIKAAQRAARAAGPGRLARAPARPASGARPAGAKGTGPQKPWSAV